MHGHTNIKLWEEYNDEDSDGVIFLIILHMRTHLNHSTRYFLVGHFQRVYPLGKKRRSLFEVLWNVLTGRLPGGGDFLAVPENAD
jgi:hypothetical protein